MPPRYSEARLLSPKQLKNPLLRQAHERLTNIVEHRGKYLRGLDTANGDRRTRLEKFVGLATVSEQLLVRLDLATGVIGFLDMASGEFVLNTQRNIANDSNYSEAAFSRLLATLEKVNYVYRRSERVRLEERDENGLHLVRTRVLIRFTKLFWSDLGLLQTYNRVQNAAKKRRDAELREIGQRRLRDMERYSLEQLRRETSRQRWHAKESGDDASVARAGSASNGAEQSVSSPPGPNSVMSMLEKLEASRAKKTQQ
ncbi:hypothetical protein [Pseudomonas fragariae (ex Marin et al. 2024)]|uniref:hypothetical protein n=1 Tax=Pseudomonas fragariae (ex Marin et al. 2024) TaxID=3080056 RepID=UPI003F7B156D